MYITDCNQINIYAQNNIIIIIFSLFLDFAFRNCSVAGWLQEDGMVDRGGDTPPSHWGSHISSHALTSKFTDILSWVALTKITVHTVLCFEIYAK